LQLPYSTQRKAQDLQPAIELRDLKIEKSIIIERIEKKSPAQLTLCRNTLRLAALSNL
jgi:hypothetical protein